MKLLEFVQKFKLLTATIIIFNIIFASFLILFIIRPLEWLKFSQRIIDNNVNQDQTNTTALNYESKYIEGKILEIKDNLIKIQSADSFYSININQDTPIQFLDNNQSMKITDLEKGWQIGLSIDGSKFTSPEPFAVEYIMVLKESDA